MKQPTKNNNDREFDRNVEDDGFQEEEEQEDEDDSDREYDDSQPAKKYQINAFNYFNITTYQRNNRMIFIQKNE